MGAIAPVFSAVGSIVGAFAGMGGGGGGGAPYIPPPPPPPPPEPKDGPDAAAMSAAERRRALSRQGANTQNDLLSLAPTPKSNVRTKSLLGE